MIRTKSRRVVEQQEVVVRGDVVDAEPRLIWSGGKVRWRPETIRVTWVREKVNGGGWSAWEMRSASVNGPKVKANGEPFANNDSHTERVYRLTGPSEWSGWVGSTKPAPDRLPSPV